MYMNNHEMAVQWGTKMAGMTKEGGSVTLGLVGSGFDLEESLDVFKEISEVVPVRLIKVSVGVGLYMEKL